MQAISSTKANEEEVFNVHNLYKLQLHRTESDQRVLAEESCHCFNMALNLIKLVSKLLFQPSYHYNTGKLIQKHSSILLNDVIKL